MADAFGALAQELRSGDVILALAIFLIGTSFCVLVARAGGLTAGRRFRQYQRFSWQLGALLGLEQAYEFARGRIPHESDLAVLNAYRVLDLEWRHGFFVEERVQRFFLHYHFLMNSIDLFYALGHLGVTLGVLGWIYWRHREHYPFVRNLIMLTTAIALVGYYVYPTAPPRMLPNYGFVDPAYLHHLAPAGGDQPWSYTYNPYAAMPSLHVGYALVVACGLVVASRSVLLRVLAILYPCAMAAAVVISGNHWLLDVVGAVVTVALACGLLGALSVALVYLRSLAPEKVRGPSTHLPAG